MDLPSLMVELGQLGVAVSRLGVIGAALRLQASDEAVSPEIKAGIRDVMSVVLPGSLEGLSRDDIGVSLNYIAFMLEEAREVLRNPVRSPVWQVEDHELLQAMGDLSRALPRRILAFASDRPALSKATAGRFLDVGTGVAAIALEAAARCPTLQVVGLDIWEPALRLARANVAASPYAERIEIRSQSITDLDETAAYTLAFLAAPFMSRDLVEVALDRLSMAIASNGYLVVSIYVPQDDETLGALTTFRRARSGGYAWTIEAMRSAITARGFVDVEVQPGPSYLGVSPTLVFARRSSASV